MNDLILYLFESGICLALFYFLYWIFLKNETFFAANRFFLIFSILFSFVVPFINLTSPFAAPRFIDDTYALDQATGTQINFLGASGILVLIYILGVSFFLFRLIHQFLKLFKLIKRNNIQKHNGLNVILVEKDISPFSFFNFIFVNKSNISNTDFRRIIAHEMIHIKQYHSIDLIILELLTIFQWFNPFVWPYKKSLKETHEYLADNAVIAQGCDTARYQLLIFEQHVGVKLFEFANNFNHSQIKRRITMMTKNKSKRWAKFKVLLILPMFLLLVLAFADSKTVRISDQTGQSDADKALLAHDDSKGPVKAEDDEKAEKKKKKDIAKKEEEMKKKKKEELIKKEEKLKAMLKETEDPEKRKEIKMKLKQLQEMKGHEMSEKEALLLKKKKLKKLYSETDNPEKKKEIKKYLEEIEKKEKEMKKKAAEKAKKEKK